MLLLLPHPAFESVVKFLDADSKLALWQTCNKELARLLTSSCQLTIVVNSNSDQRLKALQALINPTCARVAVKLASSSDQELVPISVFEPVLTLPVWKQPGPEHKSVISVLCLEELTLQPESIGEFIRRHIPNVTRLNINRCSVHQHTRQQTALPTLCQPGTKKSKDPDNQQNDELTLPEVLNLQVLSHLQHLHISLADGCTWTHGALQKQLAQLPHLTHLSLGPLPWHMPAHIFSDLPPHVTSLVVDFERSTGPCSQHAFCEQHFRHLKTNTHLRSLELRSLQFESNEYKHAPVSLTGHMPLLQHLHMSAVVTDEQFQSLLQHSHLTSLCLSDTQFEQSYANVPCKLKKLKSNARFLSCQDIAKLPLAGLTTKPVLPNDIWLCDDVGRLVEWAVLAAANLCRCGGFVINPSDGLNILQTCDVYGDQSCCVHVDALAAQYIAHVLSHLKQEIKYLRLTRLPVGQETVQALNIASQHNPRLLHFVECDLEDSFWTALSTLLHSNRLSALTEVHIEDCNPILLEGLSHLHAHSSASNCNTSPMPAPPAVSELAASTSNCSTAIAATGAPCKAINNHLADGICDYVYGKELSTTKRLRLLVSWCPDRLTEFGTIHDAVQKLPGFVKFERSCGVWVDHLWTAEIELAIRLNASTSSEQSVCPAAYCCSTTSTFTTRACKSSCHIQHQ